MPMVTEDDIEANPHQIKDCAQPEISEPDYGKSQLLNILAKHCRQVAEADARKKRS